MTECLKMRQTDVEEERHVPFDLMSSNTAYGIISVCAVAEFVISLAIIPYESSYRHSYNSSLFV